MKESSSSKNLIFKIASLVVSVAIGFIQTRMVVEAIGGELYGFYSLSNDFVNYATILTIAINSMANRYISISFHQGDEAKGRSYFNGIFFSNIFFIIVFAIIAIPVIWNLSDLINIPTTLQRDVVVLFIFMAVNFGVSLFFSVFSVSTFVSNRIDLESMRNIEGNVIKIGLIFIAFRFSTPRIWYMGIASIITTIYIGLTNIYYTRKFLPRFYISRKLFDKNNVLEMLKVGMWNSFTRISSIMLTELDLLICNLKVSPIAMGAVAVVKILPKTFHTSMNSLTLVFSPSITNAYARKDYHAIRSIICDALAICSLISTGAMVVLITLGQRLFQLWVPSQDPIYLQNLCIACVVGYVVVIPMEPLWYIFTLTNKTKTSSIYLFIQSVLSISIVFLAINSVNDEFYKTIIILGVSSLLEILTGALFLPISASRMLNIEIMFFVKTIIRNFITFLLATFFGYIVNKYIPYNNWLLLIALAGVVFLVTEIFGFVIILNKNQKEKMISRLARR